VRQVTIRNGRPSRTSSTSRSPVSSSWKQRRKVRDFFDAEELKRVYYPEAEALIKKVSGASRVVVFDHTLRSGDEAEREARLVREPVLNVHNDYTEWSGPQRVRDLVPAKPKPCCNGASPSSRCGRAINKPIQSTRSPSRTRAASLPGT